MPAEGATTIGQDKSPRAWERGAVICEEEGCTEPAFATLGPDGERDKAVCDVHASLPADGGPVASGYIERRCRHCGALILGVEDGNGTLELVHDETWETRCKPNDEHNDQVAEEETGDA